MGFGSLRLTSGAIPDLLVASMAADQALVGLIYRAGAASQSKLGEYTV